MTNILEKRRAAHEEIEYLEEGIVEQILAPGKTRRERLVNDHIIGRYLGQIAKRSIELSAMYDDKDGHYQSELEKNRGDSKKMFEDFYEQFTHIKKRQKEDQIKERPFLSEEMNERKMELQEQIDEELDHLFSGEEGAGQYLDLNELYGMFINLKNVKNGKDVKKPNYLRYLEIFDQFASEHYPKTMKGSDEYKDYLDHLLAYITDFFQRAKPLTNLAEVEANARREFDASWAAGEVPGWEDVASAYSDTSLFCTACQKQFMKNSVYDAHLKGKKHIKAQQKLDENRSTSTATGAALLEPNEQVKDDRRKATAWKERLISAYIETSPSLRQETRDNVERKQTMTDKEREQEQEQDEVDIADESDEEEERFYNPLNLPMGWDGKPIPYWLYKLHGLGVEYPCEICGNYVYMGRKTFDKHFQESKHTAGLRYLGISNSRHYNEITQINDAFAMQQRLKKESIVEENRMGLMEEKEDEEGNVYDKRTYDDLKRQGIL